MESIFFPSVAGYPILITFDPSLVFYLTAEFWLSWNSIAQSRQEIHLGTLFKNTLTTKTTRISQLAAMLMLSNFKNTASIISPPHKSRSCDGFVPLPPVSAIYSCEKLQEMPAENPRMFSPPIPQFPLPEPHP